MKKLWMVIPALLVMFGMVLTGCGNGSTAGVEEPGDITWSLSQDGEEDADGIGTKTTTEITITLSAAADLLGNNIVVLSTGNVNRGATTGSGTVWKVPITSVTNPGNVSVTINKVGVEPGPQMIRVIKKDEAAPITYEAEADGEPTVTTSTKITFTFSKAVTGLQASDIGFTPTGAVTKGTLAADPDDDKVWVLNLTAVETEGNVTVKITKSGIDAGNQTVAVYKAVFNPDLYDFTPVPIVWKNASTEDKEGSVVDEDFLMVKYSKQGSFVRVTFELQGQADGTWGSPQGMFGQIGKSDTGINVMIPTSTPKEAEVAVDIPVADLLANIGADAYYFYVNIHNSKIVSFELVETKDGTRPTNPGLAVVSFDLDGGIYLGEDEIDDVKVEKGKALLTRFPSSAPQKQGFIPKGWFDGATEYEADTPITADVTLKVKWEAGQVPTYTVKFDTDGGTPSTIPDIEDVEEGQPIGATNFPANPRKDGQWFDGWVGDDEEDYTATTPITANVTLTAQWTPNTQPPAMANLTIDGFKFKQRIYNDYAGVDRATGKGHIAGEDLEAIRTADGDDILVVYIYNTSDGNRNWGVGSLETATKSGEGDRLDISTANTPIAATTAGYAKVAISAIKSWLISADTYINVNIWSDCIVQKIELWEVDPDYVAPSTHDFNLTLAVNGAYGHQGKYNAPDWLLEALGGKITKDVVYKVTFDVEADTAPDYLNLSLVDNGPDNNNYQWTILATPVGGGVYPIGTTGSPSTVTATFNPASATSSGVQGQANILVIETGADVLGTIPGPINLTITNFVLEIVE